MAMARMTFTVPEEVKRRAQACHDVNWSAVVARAVEQRLAQDEAWRRWDRGNRLTQRDVDEIAASIDRSMARRYRETARRRGSRSAGSSSTRTAS
jgi:hypothetical protein